MNVSDVLLFVFVALLMAAFVTDLIYLRTLSIMWETFSDWLLTAGLILAALAGLALLLDVLLGRIGRIAWLPLAGLTAAALLSLLNAFVHSRDGYTAVVPEGIVLSGVVTVLLLAAGWREIPSVVSFLALYVRRASTLCRFVTEAHNVT